MLQGIEIKERSYPGFLCLGLEQGNERKHQYRYDMWNEPWAKLGMIQHSDKSALVWLEEKTLKSMTKVT